MPFSLRLAAPEDAAAIVEIYAPYVLQSCATFESEVPSVEEYRERIEETRRFFPFFILEENGVPVGYSCAHFFHVRRAYQWMCETTIYVRQGHHRSGVATLLYRALLSALREQGFCEAVAILGCPNQPSERFHESMGFRLVASYPAAGYKLGEWHDIEWYGLSLRPRPAHPSNPLPFDTLPEEFRKNLAELPSLSE